MVALDRSRRFPVDVTMPDGTTRRETCVAVGIEPDPTYYTLADDGRTLIAWKRSHRLRLVRDEAGDIPAKDAPTPQTAREAPWSDAETLSGREALLDR